MENKDCFNSENFLKVKEYILHRVLVSGMGKFYVEYPQDTTNKNDSIMKPSNHPENVYDVRFDETSDQIVFESPTIYISFHSQDGFIHRMNITDREQILANEIFCYLLDNSNK